MLNNWYRKGERRALSAAAPKRDDTMFYWYLEFVSNTGEKYVIGDQARFSQVRSMAKRALPGERVHFRPPLSATRNQLEELDKLGAKNLRA